MIFATTGTQAPFDRFLRIIDRIAGEIDEEIVVQAFRDEYDPKNIRVVEFIEPDVFNEIFVNARVIVSHAGMGTIITAMHLGKPIVVFPRMASKKEHRNDHQMATSRQLRQMGYVHVAFTEDELVKLVKEDNLPILHKLDDGASPSLVQSLVDFINQI